MTENQRSVKRNPTHTASALRVGNLHLDLNTRQVTQGEQVHQLTPKQCRLLYTFMLHPGEILSREFLMREVWDTTYTGDTRTLEVHVRWIRKMIEHNPSRPQYLRTVRGVGYRFDCRPGET